MIFGFNMFGNTRSFNASETVLDEEETVYQGYTIKQITSGWISGGYTTWSYKMTTTVVGINYKNIAEGGPISFTETMKAIEDDKETTLAEAVAYIDSISQDEKDDNNTIKGCTYEKANNYDKSATEDDGSCTYDDDEEDDENFSPWILAGGAVLVTLVGFKLMKS